MAEPARELHPCRQPPRRAPRRPRPGRRRLPAPRV